MRIDPLFSLIYVTARSLQRLCFAVFLNYDAWPHPLIFGMIISIVYAFEENIIFMTLLILLIRLSFFFRYTQVELYFSLFGVNRYFLSSKQRSYIKNKTLTILLSYCNVWPILSIEKSTAWFHIHHVSIWKNTLQKKK